MKLTRQPDVNWRPMESAPKDGRRFLAFEDSGEVVIVSWWTFRKVFADDGGHADMVLMYWMPLPAPPVEERPEIARVSPSILPTSFAVEQLVCAACGHQHADASLGGICIGCPCEEVQS